MPLAVGYVDAIICWSVVWDGQVATLPDAVCHENEYVGVKPTDMRLLGSYPVVQVATALAPLIRDLGRMQRRRNVGDEFQCLLLLLSLKRLGASRFRCAPMVDVVEQLRCYGRKQSPKCKV